MWRKKQTGNRGVCELATCIATYVWLYQKKRLLSAALNVSSNPSLMSAFTSHFSEEASSKMSWPEGSFFLVERQSINAQEWYSWQTINDRCPFQHCAWHPFFFFFGATEVMEVVEQVCVQTRQSRKRVPGRQPRLYSYIPGQQGHCANDRTSQWLVKVVFRLYFKGMKNTYCWFKTLPFLAEAPPVMRTNIQMI